MPKTKSSMSATLLSARRLRAGYGSTTVVRDLDIEVAAGEVVALLGPNGAGKTTTLMTLAGHLPALGGEVSWGERSVGHPLFQRARDGLGLVTEERAVFMNLTVAENLRVSRANPAVALEIFPDLIPHLHRRVGHLSGGQQQMLALARALARKPKVLLADELSLGLAPVIVDRLLTEVRAAADRGLGVLLVEQHVQKVLEIADRVHVLRHGEIAASARGPGLAHHLADIQAAYFPPTGVPKTRALPKTPPRQRPEDRQVSPEDNKAVVQGLIAATNAQDMSAIETYIAPDFVNHAPEVFPGIPEGIEGTRPVCTAWANVDDGVHLEIEFQIAADDFVVTRLIVSGRHTADFLGLPPTGRSWTMRAIVINRVREGKLVEQWAEVDVLGKLRAVGGEVCPPASVVGAGGQGEAAS